MGSLKFLESNILITIWFNQLVWLLCLTLIPCSYYSPKELFKQPIKIPGLCCGSSWPLANRHYRLQVHLFHPLYVTVFFLGMREGSNIQCIYSLYHHHLTHAPWFVSTSSALLCKKTLYEQMEWTRSLLTRVMQGSSPHLALQRHPWAEPLRHPAQRQPLSRTHQVRATQSVLQGSFLGQKL